MSDVILLIVNVILTIASAVGAWKSNKYYTKSRHIINYAQVNKALIEINNMLTKLPEALSAANKSAQGKRGMSLQNNLCGIGRELNKNLLEIRTQTSHTQKLENSHSITRFSRLKYNLTLSYAL